MSIFILTSHLHPIGDRNDVRVLLLLLVRWALVFYYDSSFSFSQSISPPNVSPLPYPLPPPPAPGRATPGPTGAMLAVLDAVSLLIQFWSPSWGRAPPPSRTENSPSCLIRPLEYSSSSAAACSWRLRRSRRHRRFVQLRGNLNFLWRLRRLQCLRGQ